MLFAGRYSRNMKLPSTLCLLVGCASSSKEPLPASPADTQSASETACNGHDALCDRPLSQVTLPGTHNSMSNADAGWLGANQQHGLTRQLEDGVRGMMLDTYLWEGELWLCHAVCELGSQPLHEGLTELSDFLDANPREVIQIIFQDAISIEDTRGALEDAGLADRLYTWDAGADPTLRQLIDAGTPLVVGLESGNSDDQGLHAAWDLFVDTPYSFTEISDFSCELNRGDADNPLFLMNHWIGDPLPSADNSLEANTADVLETRARDCVEAFGRPINFLGVDFYDQGDLFAVVDRLNGVDGDP